MVSEGGNISPDGQQLGTQLRGPLFHFEKARILVLRLIDDVYASDIVAFLGQLQGDTPSDPAASASDKSHRLFVHGQPPT
jgi:hypothetical protein